MQQIVIDSTRETKTMNQAQMAVTTIEQQWREHTSAMHCEVRRLMETSVSGTSQRVTGKLGTTIRWLALPFTVVFLLILGIIDQVINVVDKISTFKPKPGIIEFAEHASKPPNKGMLKTFLGKGPSLLVVFSRSHLAVLDASRQDAPPELIWQNPQGTYVLVGPPDKRRLDVHWPEAATLSLYLDEHQYQQVTNLLGPCITDVRASQ